MIEMEAGGGSMTQHEAKELTLEVWRYLAEHPECYAKMMLPQAIYEKIRMFSGQCPLCGLFSGMGGACPLCPLYKAGEGCKSENSPWGRWYTSKIINTAIRKAAASRIVEIVEAWEPEEGA